MALVSLSFGCSLPFLPWNIEAHRARNREILAQRQKNREDLKKKIADEEQARLKEPIGKSEEEIVLKNGRPTTIEKVGAIEILAYRFNIQMVSKGTSSGQERVFWKNTDMPVSYGNSSSLSLSHETFQEKQFFFKKGICINYGEITQK